MFIIKISKVFSSGEILWPPPHQNKRKGKIAAVGPDPTANRFFLSFLFRFVGGGWLAAVAAWKLFFSFFLRIKRQKREEEQLPTERSGREAGGQLISAFFISKI